MTQIQEGKNRPNVQNMNHALGRWLTVQLSTCRSVVVSFINWIGCEWVLVAMIGDRGKNQGRTKVAKLEVVNAGALGGEPSLYLCSFWQLVGRVFVLRKLVRKWHKAVTGGEKPASCGGGV